MNFYDQIKVNSNHSFKSETNNNKYFNLSHLHRVNEKQTTVLKEVIYEHRYS